ncbi:RNA-directed DNA polymerase, eukaryota, reverse transcriptase zinc-binding domain protein [Tanacetum coccineum]
MGHHGIAMVSCLHLGVGFEWVLSSCREKEGKRRVNSDRAWPGRSAFFLVEPAQQAISSSSNQGWPNGSTSSHQPAMKGKIRDSSIRNTKDNGHRDDDYTHVFLNGEVKEGWCIEKSKSVALGMKGFTDIDFNDTWVGFVIHTEKRVTNDGNRGYSFKSVDKNTFIRIASMWGTLLNVENLENSALNYHCKRPFVFSLRKFVKRISVSSDEDGIGWENDVSRCIDYRWLRRRESKKSKDGVDSSEKWEKGGLGVSSLYALNRALMCKWVWRFTTQKNLLWTRVIKAIHGEDGKNGSGFKVGYKSIWRSILQEVETLKIKGIHLNNFMQKKLGNGADTYFWEDLWHGDMVLKQRYPRLYALEVKKTVDVASKLWYWTLDGSGELSVASARKVIDDNRFPEVSTQTRWIKAVSIKVNIHAWKVRMDCLPTRLNISRRGIDIPSILCPVCGSVTESSSHLFFDCLVAKDNFRKICRWWEVDFMEVHTFDEWVSWIVNLRIPIKHKRLLEGVCFGLWWLIWAYRNKCVFGVVSPSKADIFDDVVSYSFYWSRFRCNVSFSWVDWLKNPHLVTL